MKAGVYQRHHLINNSLIVVEYFGGFWLHLDVDGEYKRTQNRPWGIPTEKTNCADQTLSWTILGCYDSVLFHFPPMSFWIKGVAPPKLEIKKKCWSAKNIPGMKAPSRPLTPGSCWQPLKFQCLASWSALCTVCLELLVFITVAADSHGNTATTRPTWTDHASSGSVRAATSECASGWWWVHSTLIVTVTKEPICTRLFIVMVTVIKMRLRLQSRRGSFEFRRMDI